MSVHETLEELAQKVKANPQPIRSFAAVYHLVLSGREEGTYEIKFANDEATYRLGMTEQAGCTLELSADHFIKLVRGTLNPVAALVTGKLKIKGDMGLSLKLQTLLYAYQSPLEKEGS
ncbi:SCP2 sterol-binding domain-containing protein [Brevibacillus sp. SAFN-007a]|uniref:SCP2 sterol-binding domain-containing protein n=1 Tax=Brevibacillus sp. SAFN-007a TaxID=3436862 RepID=UPI003F80C2EA